MSRRRGAPWAWAAVVLAACLSVVAQGALAEAIRISGTGGAIGAIRSAGEKFRKSHPEIVIVIVPSMGSSGGIRAVLAGKLDIGLSAQPLTGEERAAGAVGIPYARTPFAFATHRRVETGGVTLSDAVAIYSGRRGQWPDGSRIRLVLRPATDSDLPVLKGMSPAMAAAVEDALRREGMIVGMTDQDAASCIETTPGAFGAVTLAIVVSEKRPVRLLPLDGIPPTTGTLAKGAYPFFKTFYIVTRKNPSPAVRRFIEFVRSPAGAAILANNGQLAVR